MAAEVKAPPGSHEVHSIKLSTQDADFELRADVPSDLQRKLTPQPFALPSFAVSLLHHSRSTWGLSATHPFVKGLEDGTLEASKFKRYLMQDARYLGCFGDACALVSTRIAASRPTEKCWFLRAALMGHEVEASLHMQYGKTLGFTAEDVAAVPLSPAAEGYTAHMLRCASCEDVVVAIAALGPCPWLYSDVGLTVAARLRSARGTDRPDNEPLVGPEHPYGPWLATYADDGFIKYVREQLHYLDIHAREAGWGSTVPEQEDFDFMSLPPQHPLRRAAHAFHTSARYEWMFWQQGWSDEAYAWPV